mmetsp:Transcript_34794/g.58043  ORF Transcript_34794/g.58043 Transcript_34794/m.58043 type:complete len:84 (-) Transcript_34794:434-685(-)
MGSRASHLFHTDVADLEIGQAYCSLQDLPQEIWNTSSSVCYMGSQMGSSRLRLLLFQQYPKNRMTMSRAYGMYDSEYQIRARY